MTVFVQLLLSQEILAKLNISLLVNNPIFEAIPGVSYGTSLA